VLRSTSYLQGLDYFTGNQRVGFKDFLGFVEEFSAGIKARAEQIAQRAGRPFIFVASGQASEGSAGEEAPGPGTEPRRTGVRVVVCRTLPDLQGAADRRFIHGWRGASLPE
jgi:hypothetical protein